MSYASGDYLKEVTSYCTPVLASSVRDKAAELLSAVTRTLAVKKEEDKKGELGMTADHELYVYLILQEYLHMETALSQPSFSDFKLTRAWSEEEMAVRNTLLDQIEVIRSRCREASTTLKLELVFERLFVNVLLEQIFKPEYSQFIPDLVECYKQFTQQESKRTDERPLAVLLEIVLILLRTSSKTLRDTAIQLFGNVCGDLQEEDVRDMLSVFWNDEGIEESEEESEEVEMSVEEGEDDNEKGESDSEEMEESRESEEEKEDKESGGDEAGKAKEKNDEDTSSSDDEWEIGVLCFIFFSFLANRRTARSHETRGSSYC